MTWTVERVERLKKLCADGLSFGRITDELGRRTYSQRRHRQSRTNGDQQETGPQFPAHQGWRCPYPPQFEQADAGSNGAARQGARRPPASRRRSPTRRRPMPAEFTTNTEVVELPADESPFAVCRSSMRRTRTAAGRSATTPISKPSGSAARPRAMAPTASDMAASRSWRRRAAVTITTIRRRTARHI